MFDKAQEEQMALAEKKRVVEEDKAKILEVPLCLSTGPIDCFLMCPSWLGAVEEDTAKILEVLAGCRPLSAPWWLGVE